jgi:hypothetical protein
MVLLTVLKLWKKTTINIGLKIRNRTGCIWVNEVLNSNESKGAQRRKQEVLGRTNRILSFDTTWTA